MFKRKTDCRKVFRIFKTFCVEKKLNHCFLFSNTYCDHREVALLASTLPISSVLGAFWRRLFLYSKLDLRRNTDPEVPRTKRTEMLHIRCIRRECGNATGRSRCACTGNRGSFFDFMYEIPLRFGFSCIFQLRFNFAFRIFHRFDRYCSGFRFRRILTKTCGTGACGISGQTISCTCACKRNDWDFEFEPKTDDSRIRR